jgi:hypothetical protein
MANTLCQGHELRIHVDSLQFLVNSNIFCVNELSQPKMEMKWSISVYKSSISSSSIIG